MRILWLLLCFAACTPTYFVTGSFPDAGDDAPAMGDAMRVETGDDAAVTFDVPVLLDASIVDRPMAHDQGAVIDRPAPSDVVAAPDVIARDIVLVSDVPFVGPFGLRPGDRIRGSSPATYVYGMDGRRHIFINEVIYYSWYPNQNGIIQLADGQLGSIPLGPNVTVRPGTWLVKITTDPKLYAVTRCGVLRWVTTETLGRTLFGPNWNTGTASVIPIPGVRRARDIPETAFIDYRIGAQITTATHPDGSLIRYPGSAERFLVQNGLRRRITVEGFTANRFNEAFVTETTIAYPDGAPITAYESELSDPVACAP